MLQGVWGEGSGFELLAAVHKVPLRGTVLIPRVLLRAIPAGMASVNGPGDGSSEASNCRCLHT